MVTGLAGFFAFEQGEIYDNGHVGIQRGGQRGDQKRSADFPQNEKKYTIKSYTIDSLDSFIVDVRTARTK